MALGSEELDAVFGSDSRGNSARDRAATSSRAFVRAQDELAIDSPEAIGRRLTALEALEAFGPDKLFEVVEYGSAVLPVSRNEPSETLRHTRERLGLSAEAVARRAGLDTQDVLDAERAETTTPIRKLERIAMALGLDERLLGVSPGAGGDQRLGARLKQIGTTGATFSAALVGTFAEVAWVIRTEGRLRALLGWRSTALNRFSPDTYYGSRDFPTWEYGFVLAARARTALDIGSSDTVRPIRRLVFKIGIPLLQAELPERIAGATISIAGYRGIVVNTVGQNSNVWVRRSTIAHELGHLLWDPDDRLKSVHVDEYSAIVAVDSPRDNVEGRANAFAVEFLAPRRELERMFRTSTTGEAGLRAVMERFGVSFTAARFHVWNACDRTFLLDSLMTDWAPTADWQGTESFGDDWFPIEETPRVRRGGFAACVVAARRLGLIHEDTAAAYLQTDNNRYRTVEATIAEMYADEISDPTI